MRRLQSLVWALICFWSLGFVVATQVGATLIVADTSGASNYSNEDFYGVTFIAGSGFVKSVTFDLTPDADAFFDIDGSLSFFSEGSGFADDVVFGRLAGLSPEDISVERSNFIGDDPAHPAALTFNFAVDSFSYGDFFRFSADTDFLVTDPVTPGGVFGAAGVLFSVAFQDGLSESAVFRKVSGYHSVATIVAAPVPEPATMLVLGTGLIGLAGLRRIRRHSQTAGNGKC